MTEALTFALSSFWRFAGCALLLWIPCAVLDNIVANIAKAVVARKGAGE